MQLKITKKISDIWFPLMITVTSYLWTCVGKIKVKAHTVQVLDRYWRENAPAKVFLIQQYASFPQKSCLGIKGDFFPAEVFRRLERGMLITRISTV